MARSTAAASGRKRIRCRSKRAATCSSTWARSPRPKATRRSPGSIGRCFSEWAEYLKEKGLDPENQLSTDDFAGHLAHNANLSIKAILALGAYGMLAEMTGHKQEAAQYRATAEQFAKKWQDLAANGDHYRLAFDKAGTWSQKYNLVWDRIARAESVSRRSRRERNGVLREDAEQVRHCRWTTAKAYTKLDWLVWTRDARD